MMNKILKSRRLPLLFLGVFASDRLPTNMLNYRTQLVLANGKVADGVGVILNVEPQFMNGAHWVAFFRENLSPCIEFFDSFGKDPLDYGFRLPQPFIFNTFQMQSATSLLCGEYCITFLIFRSQLLTRTNSSILAASSTDRFNRCCTKMYFLGNSTSSRDKEIRHFISLSLK